jgi:hypothetical protein
MDARKVGAQEERNPAAAAEMVGVIVGEWVRRCRKQEGGDLRMICLLIRSSGQLHQGVH